MSYAIREALAAFRRTPALTTLSAIMVALALYVVGLFGISAHNIRLVLEQVESRVQVVAYLRDTAPSDAVELALSEIQEFGEVLDAVYVTREEALEQARRELPEFRMIFAELDVNPLPASFEVQLRPGHRDPATVRAVADRIAAYPFVEQVSFGEEWVNRLFLLRRIAGAAALVVGTAFAVVAIIMIGAAIRLSVFARRDEIEIMRLVGATDGFIRRPFLLEGLVTGLLGAGVALGLTYGTYGILIRSEFRIEWLPDLWAGAGLAAGGLLGVIASSVALRRYLREP